MENGVTPLRLVTKHRSGLVEIFNSIDLTGIDRGRGFNFRPGRNQVTQVNSAFHPSGVGKSHASFIGWG